jgi:hypothetical protein
MPKRLYKYGIFFLVPGIVLGFSVILKVAAGPYWLATNFDPSYAYLVNGLRILKGVVPNHTDHPGTPVQILCCAVSWLFNMGRSVPGIVTQVLRTPEFYLSAVFVFLSVLSFFSSLGLAVYMYRKTGDQIAAVLTQLPALSFLVMKSWETFEPVLPVVANVDPEPLLISVVNLFSSCLLMHFFAKTTKDHVVSALFWGFVCGLGAATKLTFVPLLVIPLIVLSWKNKILFVLLFGVSFVGWTWPIISKYFLVWHFISGILSHTGVYSGQKAGRDSYNYILNWKSIFVGQGLFIMIAFVAMLFALWNLWQKKQRKASIVLFAVSLGVLLQFAVVAKYPGPHYLLPGIGLFGALLGLFYLSGHGSKEQVRQIVGVLILGTVLVGTWRALEYRSNLARLTEDIIVFYEHIHAKYQGYVFLGYYRSSGQDAALRFGDGWNGQPALKEEMSLLFPDRFFFMWGSNRVNNFKDRVFLNDLLERFSGVIFQGDDSYGDILDVKGAPFTVRLLEKGRMESAYLLTATTEKQAVMFFAEGARFLQEGNYAQALAFAKQAKAFHYQPESSVDQFIKFITPYVQQ